MNRRCFIGKTAGAAASTIALVGMLRPVAAEDSAKGETKGAKTISSSQLKPPADGRIPVAERTAAYMEYQGAGWIT